MGIYRLWPVNCAVHIKETRLTPKGVEAVAPSTFDALVLGTISLVAAYRTVRAAKKTKRQAWLLT